MWLLQFIIALYVSGVGLYLFRNRGLASLYREVAEENELNLAFRYFVLFGVLVCVSAFCWPWIALRNGLFFVFQPRSREQVQDFVDDLLARL
jgi:hypothetical protein